MKSKTKKLICSAITFISSIIFYVLILKNGDIWSNDIITLPVSGLSMPEWLLIALNFLLFPLLTYCMVDGIVDRISTTTI